MLLIGKLDAYRDESIGLDNISNLSKKGFKAVVDWKLGLTELKTK